MRTKYKIVGTSNKEILSNIDAIINEGYFKYNVDSTALEIEITNSKRVIESESMSSVLGSRKAMLDPTSDTTLHRILINRDKCVGTAEINKAIVDILGQVLAHQHRKRFSENTDIKELIIILKYYAVYMSYSLLRAVGIDDAKKLLDHEVYSREAKECLIAVNKLPMNDINSTANAMMMFSIFAPFDGHISIKREKAASDDDIGVKLTSLFLTQQIEMGRALTTFFNVVSSGYTLKPYDYNALKLSIKLMDHIVNMENDTAIAYFNERPRKVKYS